MRFKGFLPKSIDVLIILLHLIIGVGFVILSLISIRWSSNFGIEACRSCLGNLAEYLFVLMGMIIVIVSLIFLFKRNLRLYYTLIFMTLLTFICWLVLVSAYDMIVALIIYVAIIIPLTVVKKKRHF